MTRFLYLLFYMVFVMVIVISPFISGAPVFADSTEDDAIGDITDPGILPDSGLYFMKQWGRNLQLIFAAGDAEKARLMLKYTNEDALALKKMYELGKYDIGARHAEQYSSQLQNTIQTVEQVKLQQGEKNSEDIIAKLEQNYLRQQEVLLSVLEKAPEAAQNGILNAIENSNKHISKMILAYQGEAALEQHQQQLMLQTANMGESTKIKVQQRLQAAHGQAAKSSASNSGQGTIAQQTTMTQSQNQTSQQTMQQTQQGGQQNMQNQEGEQGNSQGNGNKKQGK